MLRFRREKLRSGARDFRKAALEILREL